MYAQHYALPATARMAGALFCRLAHRACRWTALGLLAARAVGPPPARAAVTEVWVQRYSNVLSNSNDRAVRVVSDAAGDVIVIGSTDDGITGSDMLTIKYSGADGSVLWQKRYNGPGNSDDVATALALDSSFNVVVTGSSGEDFYTAKYATADGALLWQRRYSYGHATALAVDSSGNAVVTGSSPGTNFYADYYTAKYAADDGALLWEKRYNGPANYDDNAQAVAVDGNGNVVVTGSSGAAVSDNDGLVISDYYTAKYAGADGTLLWEKRYNGPANDRDEANAVALDGSGNVVVTGSSHNAITIDEFGNSHSDTDYYTAKYAAADGTLLWEQRYNGPACPCNASRPDFATAVALDSSGNVVVTGASGWANGFGDFFHFYTAKYAAADGALLWENRSGLGGDGRYDRGGQSVAVDGSGNVLVTGSSDGDYYTAKYAATDGALLWEKHFNGPENGNDYASAVALDGSGNVLVTGSSDGDYYTAKYAAADGALLWEKRFNGPTENRSDFASAVAADSSGNVVVTGSSMSAENGSDYYTAKYATANGALLWEKRYNGPANGDDSASAVGLDAEGNVVVTGSSATSGSVNSGFISDYYTAKYAAADGALLWEKRFNGPANRDDQPRAVAVDGNGNVIVTGSSMDSGGNYDYYTAKYAAADGALLWEKRYNGPANYSDRPQGLAVDGGGNVVVTGYSMNRAAPDAGHDYYTAKYAAADGALLWEKRYNGPANGRDEAQGVAVDGNGNVVVTGFSYNGPPSFGSDCYTAKYAAADGTLLWEQRHNSGVAYAVAVDSGGHAVVTGFFHTGPPSYDTDYYTAKYAGADGTLLWEQRYNGPANSSDSATGVGVDASGNAVVTGYSYGNGGADYYTAKYASADGALLWELRYIGPAKGHDSVGGLALGPNGLVAITGSSDGNFGFDQAYDYATVVYRENLPPVTIALVPTGVRLRFTGVPGHSYTIERAPTVTGSWSTLATPTASVSGLIEYVDITAPAGSAFYRTVQP